MKKSTGLALASIFAVLVLCGQTLGDRSMLSESWQQASAFAYGDFTQYREEIANVLGLNVDQIGYVGVTAYSDELVAEIQLIPQAGAFAPAEVNRIKDALENDDLGTLDDFKYDESAPGTLDIVITTSDDDGYYNYLVQFREQAASVLGLNYDQIGEIDIIVKPDTVVFDLELLPNNATGFGNFEESDFNRINEALRTGNLGPVYDLEYSTTVLGGLDATVWTSENQDNNYDGVENYVFSVPE